MQRFLGKIALVTGGAGGIGLATATRLAAEGATVAVLDLNKVERPAEAKGGWLSLTLDGTDKAALSEAIEQVEAELGSIDILFNNLGQSCRERASLFCESDEEVWRFVTDINLISTMRACRLIAPSMKARGKGRIVNMSSDAALSGDLRLADYAAAKLGVIGFTRALAQELAPHGVTVNAVCPGAIATEAHRRIPRETLDALVAATPVGFIATPAEVGGLVAYIASDEARFVTGQTIAINGGRNML